MTAGATLALALALGSAAGAQTFNYTNSEVTWTAPVTGVYDITAFGAQGGVGYLHSGGRGAEISR